jgi:capsular polysaccharide biosynthesis protein
MEEENVIYPSQIFGILKRKYLVILLVTILCAAAAFTLSKYIMTPKYTASASMYVFSDTSKTESIITSNELTASQKLVNTYIVVLKSETVLDQVIVNLNINLTADDIRERMTAGAIDGTEAFTISIEDSDPKRAQQIVNAIADIAPQEIIRVVKAGGVEVIDYAKEPAEASSPNVMLYTLAGALIGLVVSFGVFMLAVIFDTKIHGEDDLLNNFKLPVLGVIPTLKEQE